MCRFRNLVAAATLTLSMLVIPARAQAPAAAAPTVDDALKLLAAAKSTYSKVKDYSCLFIKKERIGGQLQQDNVIAMQVRTKPFSVYMLWYGPRESKGQEACYVTGQNNGMMRIHATGLLRSAVGFVSIDPNDPRVKQSSRHSITEAGIGNLLDVYAKRWQDEKVLGRTVVRVADYEYAKRPCVRLEMIHPYDPQHYTFYRSVVYFDKQTTMPIRVENYDWPRQQGSPGDLLESYSYVQMRFNTGISDEVFRH